MEGEYVLGSSEGEYVLGEYVLGELVGVIDNVGCVVVGVGTGGGI